LSLGADAIECMVGDMHDPMDLHIDDGSIQIKRQHVE